MAAANSNTIRRIEQGPVRLTRDDVRQGKLDGGSFLAFLLDGIVVGITATWIMRNAMFVATLTFFALYFILQPLLGNAGLWIAFLAYLLMRGLMQWLWSKRRIVG